MGPSAIKEHLEKEAALYKELISVLQKETQDLVGRDYKALYDTAARKETLVLRIQAMGAARARLFNEAAESLGMDKKGINLSSIISAITDGSEKRSLKGLQEKLISLADTIKELNSVNALVVKGSLDNIIKTLSFLGNFMPVSNYLPNGSKSGLVIKGAHLSEGF